jgi:hypothetical protein
MKNYLWEGPFCAAWFVPKETANTRVGLNQIKIEASIKAHHLSVVACEYELHLDSRARESTRAFRLKTEIVATWAPPDQLDYSNTDIVFCTKGGQCVYESMYSVLERGLGFKFADVAVAGSPTFCLFVRSLHLFAADRVTAPDLRYGPIARPNDRGAQRRVAGDHLDSTGVPASLTERPCWRVCLARSAAHLAMSSN